MSSRLLCSVGRCGVTVAFCEYQAIFGGHRRTFHSFVLYTRSACCYTYSTMQIMSTLNEYQRCLERLASTPPKRKAALVRSLLPGIEAALTGGQTLKDIWGALAAEGLQVSYHTFSMAVWRAKRKRILARGSGEEGSLSNTQFAETGMKATEERDPLANLKRLEENRPGFQWRGTQKSGKAVPGKEGANGKGQR